MKGLLIMCVSGPAYFRLESLLPFPLSCSHLRFNNYFPTVISVELTIDQLPADHDDGNIIASRVSGNNL